MTTRRSFLQTLGAMAAALVIPWAKPQDRWELPSKQQGLWLDYSVSRDGDYSVLTVWNDGILVKKHRIKLSPWVASLALPARPV